MNILRVCPTPLYTDRVYQQDGKPSGFAQAIEQLRATNLLLPGGWKAEMQALGHTVFETSLDDALLQTLWAKEHDALSALSSPMPVIALLARQIEYYKPDVVFIYAGALYRLTPDQRRSVRALCTHPFKMIGFWGDEIPPTVNTRDYFSDLDALLVSNESYRAHMSAQGIKSDVLGHGFDQAFAPPKQENRNTDIPIFIGDTGYLAPDHIRRYEMLNQLLAHTNLDVYGFRRKPLVKRNASVLSLLRAAQRILPEAGLGLCARIAYRYFPQYERAQKALALIRQANAQGVDVATLMPQPHPLAGYFIDKPPLEEKYPERLKPSPIHYRDYLALMGSYLLNINIHRDEEHDYGNIRCFEVTGVGSLLFSDNIRKMGEYFEEGHEYVGFETTEDLISKIQYYAKHPAAAKAIASAGQQKTLAHYTIKHRCRQLHDVITKL